MPIKPFAESKINFAKTVVQEYFNAKKHKKDAAFG